MTRETGTDVASHTTSVYSLDDDTSTLVETARNEVQLGTNGSATSTLSLRRTSADGSTEVNDVMVAANAQTSISSHDDNGSATATFDKDGLRWDNTTSSLYIGGDQFRIQYCPGDVTNNNIPALRIQAKHPVLGGFVTKMEITND